MDEDDDIAGFLVNEERRAQGRVFSSLNDDPEKGARAIQLADATGIPPAVVHGDLDHYDAQTKAKFSNQLVSTNQFLRGYINSHDLAATTSNDDLGQLDKASQSISKIGDRNLLAAFIEGYGKGAGPGGFGSWIFNTTGGEEFVRKHPYSAIAYSFLGAPYEAMRVAGGLVTGTTEMAGQWAQDMGLSGGAKYGEQIGQAMMDPGLWASIGLPAPPGSKTHMQTAPRLSNIEVLQHNRMLENAVASVDLYVRDGKEPPVGMSPILDMAKVEQMEMDIKNLGEAIKESQASATRERSPELYAAFVRQHVGDTKIGISAEKVAELYGDKVPQADDNILGWVPRISEQLETARSTGADIEVPLADFLARVDPKIAKELEDHVRVRPEGVTKEEAKVAKEEKAAGVEEGIDVDAKLITPVDVVRQNAGLEPFDVFHGSPYEFEAFDMSKIGTGEGAQSYGHGLYLAENPKVSKGYQERLGGRTIEGKPVDVKGNPSHAAAEAVELFGDGLSKHMDTIRQDIKDFENSTNPSEIKSREFLKKELAILESGKIPRFDEGVHYRARIHANKEHFLDWDKPLDQQNQHVQDALKSVLKKEIDWTQPASDFIRDLGYGQQSSDILAKADIPGIKFLDQGSRAVGAGVKTSDLIAPLMDRFNGDKAKVISELEGRISGAKELEPVYQSKAGLARIQEAIDELKSDKFVDPRTSNFVLFDASLAEITHKNDIPVKAPKRIKPKQLSLEFPKSADERDPFQRGTLIGVADYDRYLRLIEQRYQEDLASATKRVEALARKQMTTEWKADEAAIRQQVAEDLNRQPVFSADTYFRDGTFADERLPGPHRIGEEFLTPEQQASLPPSFISKTGLDPDGIAWRFGYSSGADMVNDLAGLHQQREASGKNNMAFRRDTIDAETSRRMDVKYGEKRRGMLEEAKDQALSDTQIDMLHEETLGMALKAGVEFSITKADIHAMVKERIDATLMSEVSSDKMLAAAGRAGRAEASALLKEDYAEAFRQRALKEIDAIMAKQAIELEKQREKFDATAKRFRTRSLDSVAQEYTNFIHDILLRVGEPVNRSVQDLAAEIAREGYPDLGSFTKSKSDQTFGMLQIPIPDFLLDSNFRKPVDQMTTVEFKEMHDAVAALAKLGRDETKIIREGVAADRAEVIKEMKEELGTFPLKEFDATAPKTLSPTNIFRSFLASSTNLETLLNRWDRNNPQGVFNRYIVYPLSGAANYKAALTREFSKPYGDLGSVPNAKKLVTSPLIDPLTISKDTPDGKPLANFTMGNVQVMIHNAGNEAQWIKFAKGWGADPDALMSWLAQNSTKDMWDRAQKMGDTIFKPAFEKAQTVYHNIYGIAPEKIDLKPIQTPFGEYAGWYHPLIKDPIREVYIDADGKRISGQSKAQMGGGIYDNTDNFHARTTNGYTKSRTNAFYPVDLSPDMIPIRLSQMLHDIAFRAPIIEAEKVFGDASFRNEVTKHYGEHYAQGLKPYLQGLAGAEGIPSKAFGIARSISEYFRQNVISAYIGFNPYTALKHGPTALVLSMKQVGIGEFLGAMKDLYRRSDDINLSNKEFVDKWSEEVGRRSRHWQDTIIGEHAHIYGEGTIRERVMEAGSWLVAQSDMASVRPTWLAAYRNAVREGADHGLAIDMAEASVRKAHGSTAITNQPALVSGGGPMHGWLTSIYGFFGTVMQRRIELAHAINDAYQLGKGGEIAGVAKAMPDITARTFAYVIWPTLVEEWVTGLTTEDKRGWGTHAFTAAAGGLASSVLYLRDITHSLLHGYDPGVGLLSSPLHDIKNLVNDVKKGKKMFSKENAGKLVGDFTTVFGEFTGLAPKEVGSLLRAGVDLQSGQAKPKTMKDWQLLLTRGSTKKREVK